MPTTRKAKRTKAKAHPPAIPTGRLGEAFWKRREDVASLTAKGFSIRQIARTMKLTPSMVTRDQAAMRKELRAALGQTGEDIYAEATAELAIVRKELWFALNDLPRDADHAGTRMAVLQAIAGNVGMRIKVAQSLGFIAEGPKRMILDEEDINQIADELERDPEALQVVRKLLQK